MCIGKDGAVIYRDGNTATFDDSLPYQRSDELNPVAALPKNRANLLTCKEK